MRRFRQLYYDGFSSFYDRFVALHSSDKQGKAREYLARKSQSGNPERLLDLCTGTGSLLVHLHKLSRKKALIIGLDFSWGMLQVARQKVKNLDNVFLIQADASRLPFKSGVLDAITCSHAFYELKGASQDMCLREIKRVLTPRGTFLMMEHEVPTNPVIKFLFYIRLLSMGAKRAIRIIRYERQFLYNYFSSVERITTPEEKSKILICKN